MLSRENTQIKSSDVDMDFDGICLAAIRKLRLSIFDKATDLVYNMMSTHLHAAGDVSGQRASTR